MPSTLSPSPQGSRFLPWLIPAGAVLTMLGWWGPWLWHATAGLTVTGVDFAEFVKFLPGVRDQSIPLWREVFYLPGIAVALNLAFAGHRAEFGYAYPVRLLLTLMGLAGALTLLPPAWTPGLLLVPEFRLQSTLMVLCLAAVLGSPLLAIVSRRAGAVVSLAIGVASLALPAWTLVTVWPEVARVYALPIGLGWGPFLVIPGIALMLAAWLLTPAPTARR